MTTTNITVSGMTCGHCTSAVTSELMELDGITAVDIDLVEGGDSPVAITHDGDLDQAKVREAVDEAGDYTVTF